MAMTKIEMERHRAAYYQHLSDATSALKRKAFREAMVSAVHSWDHIDGMMQYERKYESKESFSIQGIDLVLKYAPLLLDFESLDKLDALLKSQRRIAKNASANLEDAIARARATMWDAHRLWNQIESQAEVSHDKLRTELGGDQDRWRSLTEEWQEIELITRLPVGGSYRLSLSTDMNEVVLAKCPACGALARAPKAKLLQDRHCPKCTATVSFVLLARDPENARLER
jgi:hypothetical protein